MRAFIGIRVEPDAELIAMLKELDGLDYVRTVEPENLHINLKFLAEIDKKQAEETSKRLQKLAGFGAFGVDCVGVQAVPPGMLRVVISRCVSDRLEELREKLRELMDDFLPGDEKDAHLTLCRVKKKPDEMLRNFISRHAQFHMGVQVRRVGLVESVLTPDGPTYREFAGVEL